MTVSRPLLSPPAPGWTHDLPGPNEKPSDIPQLAGCAPNHSDNTYLEIPRSFTAVRGLLFWLGIPLVVVMIGVVGLDFSDLSDLDRSSVFGAGLGALSSAFLFATGLQMDVFAPRDLPMRFNRVRRKVYIYDMKAVWRNPFVRWPVRAVSYDWDDIRAEAWHQHGMLNGAYVLKYGVALSVVKPGTNEVIDRFQLGPVGGEDTWAYICTYMQQGPQALPPSEYEPRDWNNEPTLNIARLLAPKVKWPQEMNLESTTAPADHDTRSVNRFV